MGTRRHRHSPSYSDLVLGTPGLVAYWRLGERSGTVARDSLGSNHGAYVGAPTLAVVGLVGDGDTAVTLNGTSQYVGVGTPTTFDGTSPFSIIAWLNLTPDATYRSIFGSYTTGSGGVIFFSQNTAFGLGRYDAAAGDDAVAGALAAGRRFVAATYNGAVIRVYVDGVASGTTPASTRSIPAGLACRIGSSPNVYTGLAGTVDEVATFRRALVPSEIREFYEVTR